MYWHDPRWSSGLAGSIPAANTFWRMAAEYGVDVVVVNGNDHDYERFAPLDAAGQASPDGVREFVVGTGGAPGEHGLGENPAQQRGAQQRYLGGVGVQLVSGRVQLAVRPGRRRKLSEFRLWYLPLAGRTGGTVAAELEKQWKELGKVNAQFLPGQTAN